VGGYHPAWKQFAEHVSVAERSDLNALYSVWHCPASRLPHVSLQPWNLFVTLSLDYNIFIHNMVVAQTTVDRNLDIWTTIMYNNYLQQILSIHCVSKKRTLVTLINNSGNFGQMSIICFTQIHHWLFTFYKLLACFSAPQV